MQQFVHGLAESWTRAMLMSSTAHLSLASHEDPTDNPACPKVKENTCHVLSCWFNLNEFV